MHEEVEVEVEAQETAAEVAEETGAQAAEQPAEESEARAMLEVIRKAMLETAAPQGVQLEAAVRWLDAQLGEAKRGLEQAQAEIARLQPLADQGKQYREELVNQAVAEGVRALGEAFPEETYRAMLANAPLEHVRQVRDTFAGQAAARFPGGRQTRDQKEEGKKQQPDVPAAAYGAE